VDHNSRRIADLANDMKARLLIPLHLPIIRVVLVLVLRPRPRILDLDQPQAAAPQQLSSKARRRRSMTLSRLAYVLKVFPKISETFIAYELGGIAAAWDRVRICPSSRRA